jgi:hypothetical protein
MRDSNFIFFAAKSVSELLLLFNVFLQKCVLLGFVQKGFFLRRGRIPFAPTAFGVFR